MQYPLATYIINLKKRTERKNSIENEFKGKTEFRITMVEAMEEKNGAMGLWKTLRHIISDLTNADDELIIICEDDHQFSDAYNKKDLFNAILNAKQMEVEILLGGVSWFSDAFLISSNIFWIDRFSGLQFTVIFRKLFDKILNVEFTHNDTADYKISDLAKEILLIYPFISTQKEFGYSDVTQKNNSIGRVTQLFTDSSTKLSHLKKVAFYYQLESTMI